MMLSPLPKPTQGGAECEYLGATLASLYRDRSEGLVYPAVGLLGDGLVAVAVLT
jgi:hypothetical protein